MWTRIHPVFALGQLGIFVVSVGLLIGYGLGRVPFAVVHVSVLIKVAFMVGAIVTGSLWEHDVYGRWWFAYEFLVEDVMTANVFALHLGYLVIVYAWPGHIPVAVAILVFAYVLYAVNVGQYIVSHLRSRREAPYEPEAEIAA